jgi:Methyltransferase domain
MTIMMASDVDVVRRLLEDRPSFHRGGDARWDSLPETLEAVRRTVKPGDRTLETGAGATTVVFAASGAHHTAISPDPVEHERIRDYCRQIGVDDSRLEFVVGMSEDVLPSLLSRERTLDVAYIDGAHRFPIPQVDWCYTTRALKVGGTLLMDDITIPSITPVFRHMTLEEDWRLDATLDDRAAEFTLLAEPPSEDVWGAERLNARYPDFSFADWPKRVRLTTAYRVRRSGRRLARRHTVLRKAYHHAKKLTSQR